MNKAFVRDSDAPPPSCPEPQGCGAVGTPVPQETVRAQLGDAGAKVFSSDVYYCANPACGIAYYDAWGCTAPVTALALVTSPKNPAGPVCACLGVAAETILAEARQGRRETVLRILEHLRGASPECAGKAPDGRSCEPAVRRLFLQNRPD